jgi:hypothetical protein
MHVWLFKKLWQPWLSELLSGFQGRPCNQSVSQRYITGIRNHFAWKLLCRWKIRVTSQGVKVSGVWRWHLHLLPEFTFLLLVMWIYCWPFSHLAPTKSDAILYYMVHISTSNYLTIEQTSNTLRQLLPSAANYLNYTDVLHHPTNSCVATSNLSYSCHSNGSRLLSRCFIRPPSLLDREFPHVNVLLTSFQIYRILRYESWLWSCVLLPRHWFDHTMRSHYVAFSTLLSFHPS